MPMTPNTIQNGELITAQKTIQSLPLGPSGGDFLYGFTGLPDGGGAAAEQP